MRAGLKYFIGLLGMTVTLAAGIWGMDGGRTVKAASATITLSTAEPEIEKGEKASVVITVESGAIVGDFEAFLSYDPDILEFDTGGSLVSGGDGVLIISDMESPEQNEVKKYSISFKALKVGVSEIAISDRASVYDTEGAEMSVSSNRISIAVKASDTLSKNTGLKSLDISPGTLSPAFSGEVHEYSTEVEKETQKLFVSAVPDDQDASVSVEGNKDLKDGENAVVVKVTAPSGDTARYKITVKKPGTDQDETEPSEAPDSADNGLTVREEDGSTYIWNSFRYKLAEAPADRIPAGYVSTTLSLAGESVAAYIPESGTDTDYFLLYAVNDRGEEGFYRYDRGEETMQRYEEPKKIGSSNAAQDTAREEYNGKVSQMSIIIAVLSAVCVLLLIGIIHLLLRQKGYKDDDF